MNGMIIKRLFILIMAGLFLTACTEAYASEWGELMSIKSRTNIRAKRSSDSKVVGKLAAGQLVRADFLKDNWYAVFKLTENDRNENKAMGYVLASLLHPQKQKDSAVAKDTAVVKDTTAKPKEDTKPLPAEKGADYIDHAIVSIKNISFDISKENVESLSIEFNRFYMPALYNIEGKKKKVILVVTNVDSVKKEWSLIPVNGKMIKQIRSAFNDTTQLMKIEVDIEPETMYSASVTIDKVKNIYMLEIANMSQLIPTPPPYRLPW